MTDENTQVVVSAFDYSAVPQEAVKNLQANAMLVKTRAKRMARDMLDIGKALLYAKTTLQHGQFLSWLASECEGMSIRTAESFMQVAERFGDTPEKFATVANLQPTVLMLLAAPSTPDVAIEDVVERVDAGVTVTKTRTKEVIHEHQERTGTVPKARGPKAHQPPIGRPVKQPAERKRTTRKPLAPFTVTRVEFPGGSNYYLIRSPLHRETFGGDELFVPAWGLLAIGEYIQNNRAQIEQDAQ